MVTFVPASAYRCWAKLIFVVTNPPFSLFREYLAQLVDSGKQFLVLGDFNAAFYNEVFPLFMDGLVWFGKSTNGQDVLFDFPLHYELPESAVNVVGGKRYFRSGRARWFTNMKHAGLKQELLLYKSYSPDEFPRYDNYAAIEVGGVADIPEDYDGVMGVPVTFLDKHAPGQFELVGVTSEANHQGYWSGKRYGPTDAKDFKKLNINAAPVVKIGNEFKGKYKRFLIRHRRAYACGSN